MWMRMTTMTPTRKATSSDIAQIRQLLDASGLPSVDFHKHLDHFIVAAEKGVIIGVVGLEVHGSSALLRSLAVREQNRRTGLGRGLSTAILAYAESIGIHELALLTTTAEGFFATQGFIKVSREEIPAFVKQTEEFRKYCSSTAVCMRKEMAVSF